MKDLHAIVSRVLDITEASVNDAIAPANTASWDSFATLMLVSELERAGGLNFTTSEVAEMKSVGDIKAVLKKRGVA